MFETLQIDLMAAAGHGLHGDSIATRYIVQGIELLLQIPAPVPNASTRSKVFSAMGTYSCSRKRSS